MSQAALAVLMRWPRPGEGKSRLAADVGVAAAHDLHRCFVADTLAWPWAGPRVLAVAPDLAAVASTRAAAPRALVVAQPDGDLGVRIARALRVALDTGATRALLVGTDSPSLPHRLLVACLDAAVRQGAAMVPAEDGGFVALAVDGAAVRAHGLHWLEDGGVAWSTDRTAAQVRAAARRRGLGVGCTTPWFDVDTVAGLERLHADLRRAPGRAPRTLRCLRRLGSPPVVERAS